MPARRQARSQEEVERSQADKVQAKLLDMAAMALMGFPASQEDWNAKVVQPNIKALRDLEGAKELAKRVDKQRAEIHKITPYAWATGNKLLKMSAGERTHWLIQVLQILKYSGAEISLDLVQRYSQPGEGFKDDGPVFDATKSGKATGDGRKPDRKGDTAGAKGAGDGPSPGLPLDEAQRAFEEKAHKAPAIPSEEEVAAKHAAIAEQKARDEQEFKSAEGPVDDGKAAEPNPAAPSNVVPIKRRAGAGKGAKRGASGKPPKGSDKEIADKYAKDQEKRLGPVDPEKPKPVMLPPQPEVDLADIPDFLRNRTKALGNFNPVFDPSLDVSGID